MSNKIRLLRCIDKLCPSCRNGFCYDTSMIRLANFISRTKEGICYNWKPKSIKEMWIEIENIDIIKSGNGGI